MNISRRQIIKGGAASLSSFIGAPLFLCAGNQQQSQIKATYDLNSYNGTAFGTHWQLTLCTSKALRKESSQPRL